MGERGEGEEKVGGRKESIECSNYSLNHVLNLDCHWFLFLTGTSSLQCIGSLTADNKLQRAAVQVGDLFY